MEPEVVEANNLPVLRDGAMELTTEQVVAQVQKIQEVMARAMKQDEHFGVIPGTDKPTLLKPGAEKLCLTFRLDPQYDSDKVFDGDHLTVTATCTLYHIPTGQRIASGEGLCSTRESKYAYRKAKRVCPSCGADAIIKGREEYGGGWVCWKRRNGCGAEFGDDDRRITEQPEGRTANEDLPDSWNTVLKMADKRALIAAVLNGTAASDIFTQDLDDNVAPSPTETPSTSSSGGLATNDQLETMKRLGEGMSVGDKKALIYEVCSRLAKPGEDMTESEAEAVIARLAETTGGEVERPQEPPEEAASVVAQNVDAVVEWIGEDASRAIAVWSLEVTREGGPRRGVEAHIEKLLGDANQATAAATEATATGRCTSCGEQRKLDAAGYCEGCEPF